MRISERDDRKRVGAPVSEADKRCRSQHGNAVTDTGSQDARYIVVNLARDRGLFRRECRQSTVRGHLGLQRVPNRRVTETARAG